MPKSCYLSSFWPVAAPSLPCAAQCMLRLLTPCLFNKVGLGGGSVRINVFPDASTRLPKLDLELFHFFGRINMYINLVPRANLARSHLAAAHRARCV